ncbi:ATP-binding protein [Paenarthrobacter nicotinovorans]|uniref:ATP-binding protein n=1 Tax=Paenarthrobacter nicotinovorans TaxID=29320 RepID=UPI00380FE4C3
MSYTRMDDLARRPVIARGDGIGHQKLLNELSDVDLLVIDDFLTVGIDPEAANDLFAVLANREHRLPMLIASQPSPAYWVEALPDRVADSIVNQLANNARHSTSATWTCDDSATIRPGRNRVTGNRPGPKHDADPEQTSEGRYQVHTNRCARL